MSIGSIETEAALQRFIRNVITAPGSPGVGTIDGRRVHLEGRVEETDLAEPNTWLRLATAADRKVTFNVATVTGTGTSTATATVAHGLGTTPVAVVATASAVAGTLTAGSLIATVSNLGGMNFTLRIRDYNGTNFSDDHDVYWVAIG